MLPQRICLSGRLLSPTLFLSEDGKEYQIAPTLYPIEVQLVGKFDTSYSPWRLVRAIRIPES